jgi:hypothetical protein
VDDRAAARGPVSLVTGTQASSAMTDPTPPQRSSKRARLCSIENANRIATRVAEHVQGDTAVVKTGNPLQPFRVVLASKAAPWRTVSRVVTCNDDEPDDQ